MEFRRVTDAAAHAHASVESTNAAVPKPTATSPRWEQAYSSDAGKSWAPNWVMEFERVDEFAGAPPHLTEATAKRAGMPARRI
jgi:hypothetical protein